MRQASVPLQLWSQQSLLNTVTLLPVTTTKSTAMSKVQNNVSKSISIYLYKYIVSLTME
jgi:hypothetical protein